MLYRLNSNLSGHRRMESLGPMSSSRRCMGSRNPALTSKPTAERWCMLSEARFQEARGSQHTVEGPQWLGTRSMKSAGLWGHFSSLRFTVWWTRTLCRILQGANHNSCEKTVPTHNYFNLILFLPKIRFTSLASFHTRKKEKKKTTDEKIQRNDSQETKITLFTLPMKSNYILHKTINTQKSWVIPVIRNKIQKIHVKIWSSIPQRLHLFCTLLTHSSICKILSVDS